MPKSTTNSDEYLVERIRGLVASQRLTRAVCFVGGCLLLGIAGARFGGIFVNLGQHDFPYFHEGVLTGASVIILGVLFGGLAVVYLNRGTSRDAANPRRIRELLVRYYDRLCALKALPESPPMPPRRKWFGHFSARQSGESDAQLVERLRQELKPKRRIHWRKFLLGLFFLALCVGAFGAVCLLLEWLTPAEITGGFLMGFAASFGLLFVGLIAGVPLAVSVVGVDTRIKELMVRYHDRLLEVNGLPGDTNAEAGDRIKPVGTL